jgi:hypothetical protein
MMSGMGGTEQVEWITVVQPDHAAFETNSPRILVAGRAGDGALYQPTNMVSC